MGLNILIVDDSSLMRSMVERIVTLSELDKGLMFFAENGAEALSVMDNQWVDLVVADLNMPVMDGYTMIRNMRAHEILRSIPVLVVSTEGSETRLEKLRALGVAGIIHKPFAPEELVRAIQEVAYATAKRD